MSDFRTKLEKFLLKKLECYNESKSTPPTGMLEVMVKYAKIPPEPSHLDAMGLMSFLIESQTKQSEEMNRTKLKHFSYVKTINVDEKTALSILKANEHMIDDLIIIRDDNKKVIGLQIKL